MGIKEKEKEEGRRKNDPTIQQSNVAIHKTRNKQNKISKCFLLSFFF